MTKTVKARATDPNISGFLGIGEGKIAAAKAAGDVAREQAAAQTLLIQNLIDKAGGYNAAKAGTEAQLAATEAQLAATAAETSKSKQTTYIVIGVVLVLMVGLYFIVKAKKR